MTSRSGTKSPPTWEGLGGADPTAGARDSGGVGSAAAGGTWEAGSGRLKESLVYSGNSDEGDGSDPEGVGLPWALYRADAGVNAAVANRVPAGLGAACPLVR